MHNNFVCLFIEFKKVMNQKNHNTVINGHSFCGTWILKCLHKGTEFNRVFFYM